MSASMAVSRKNCLRWISFNFMACDRIRILMISSRSTKNSILQTRSGDLRKWFSNLEQSDSLSPQITKIGTFDFWAKIDHAQNLFNFKLEQHLILAVWKFQLDWRSCPVWSMSQQIEVYACTSTNNQAGNILLRRIRIYLAPILSNSKKFIKMELLLAQTTSSDRLQYISHGVRFRESTMTARILGDYHFVCFFF